MSDRNKRIIRIGVFVLLLAWLGFLFARKIDLATADLGRHLKNGEWEVKSGFNLRDRNSPLFENYYSYTYTDFSAINHHWGSGVIFYYISKFFGFSGLSIFYIFLSLVAFSLFFLIALGEANFALAVLAAFFLAPLIAERSEVRPEIFSYLFAGLFLFLSWGWKRGVLSKKWLWAMPLIMILWVNTHIYFFLGFLIIAVFFFAELFRKNFSGLKTLGVVFLSCGITALLNPYGFSGLIYPLSIFHNYGYPIVENRSVSFLESYGLANPNFFLVRAVVILMAVSFTFLFLVNRKRISWEYLLLTIFFSFAGWFMIRNFSFLGFFALPVLCYNFDRSLFEGKEKSAYARENAIAILYILLLLLAAYSGFQFAKVHWQTRGIGLADGIERAANFLTENKVGGPIYNNYDIGGYLIYYLPVQEKVFIDNRPEAYPASFFQDVYMKIGIDENVWAAQEEKYNFNAIVAYRRDITPWGQGFLRQISNSQNWTEVFQDNDFIIYLKKGGINQSIIDRHEL